MGAAWDAKVGEAMRGKWGTLKIDPVAITKCSQVTFRKSNARFDQRYLTSGSYTKSSTSFAVGFTPETHRAAMVIPISIQQVLSRAGDLQENISLAYVNKMKSIVVGLCALGATAQVITDDSIFYGQSPPVYPSRMVSS